MSFQSLLLKTGACCCYRCEAAGLRRTTMSWWTYKMLCRSEQNCSMGKWSVGLSLLLFHNTHIVSISVHLNCLYKISMSAWCLLFKLYKYFYCLSVCISRNLCDNPLWTINQTSCHKLICKHPNIDWLSRLFWLKTEYPSFKHPKSNFNFSNHKALKTPFLLLSMLRVFHEDNMSLFP